MHRPVPGTALGRAKARLVVSRSKRGYTKAWDEASRQFLAENPLCRQCADEGVIYPSQVTDHVIPHKGNMALFWDRSNWQPLCKHHHDSKTAKENM